MRKYYLRKRNIIFLACLLALPVLFSILIFDILVSVNKMPGWIVALFVFLIFGEIIHFVRMIFCVHLVVSANGITYSLFTRSVNVKWDEAEGVLRTKRSEGLIVNKPAFENSKSILAFTPNRTLKDIQQKIYVPLSWFSDNWYSSELGEQIKKYAPHLFEKSVQSVD